MSGRLCAFMVCICMLVTLTACREKEVAVETKTEEQVVQEETTQQETEEEHTVKKMNVQVGDYNFIATLEENEAVKELILMMQDGPVQVSMHDYSGFEKVGSLESSLPTSNQQITTQAGDIVLYNGNNIVMFYGSNSWNYTKIGKIDDLSNWEEALGSGDITAVFTLAE